MNAKQRSRVAHRALMIDRRAKKLLPVLTGFARRLVAMPVFPRFDDVDPLAPRIGSTIDVPIPRAVMS